MRASFVGSLSGGIGEDAMGCSCRQPFPFHGVPWSDVQRPSSESS